MKNSSTQPVTARGVESCTFKSGGDDCHAWLYRPANNNQRHPVIVMAHGLGGIKRMGLGKFAERFRAAGYACLLFDYRYFGESGGEPRGLLDIPSQLADWRAALDYVRLLPWTAPERVVLWGTSFAGGHTLVIAAQHPGIAAAIAQCPFTDGPTSILAVDWKTNAKVAALAVLDKLVAMFGGTAVRVAVLGKPGSAALMTSPAAVSGYCALKDASGASDVPAKVPARIALQLSSYRPGKRSLKVHCPILYCVCDRDSIAPARATLRYAAQAPKGEIARYDCEHFDIYLGDTFERNIQAQIAFLKRHVPVNSRTAVARSELTAESGASDQATLSASQPNILR